MQPGDAYRLLSFNKMLKPRRIRDSLKINAGAMQGRYFACSDVNIFPRDEVRNYFVVKGERESFVIEEERSLRGECYANG